MTRSRSFLLALGAALLPAAVLALIRKRSPRRNGDGRDLGAVFDEHVRSEFVLRDVDATMRTMTPAPSLNHVPTLAGGVGAGEVRRFYETHFIGRWPQDTKVTPVSRTVGADRVVDEVIVSFTHDVEMPALLPRIAPTGRRVELPHVVVVQFEGGRIASERIYWDQASLLAQIGLLDSSKLPVAGAEQARKVLDPGHETNLLIRRARKSRAPVTKTPRKKTGSPAASKSRQPSS